MSKADSSFFRLVYIEEATFGVTPPTPAMQEMRINGESVNFSPEYVTSQELRSDRQVPDLVQVGAEVSGDIPFELSYGSYDEWLAVAFFNDWQAAIAITGASDIDAVNDAGSGDSEYQSVSTDFVAAGVTAGRWLKVAGFVNAANNGFYQVKAVTANAVTLFGAVLVDELAPASVDITNDGTLQNGVTKKSFTLEKQFTDVPLYQTMVGCRVGGFELNFAAGEILAGQFSVMGTAASELDGSSIAASIVPADTNDKLNAVSDLTAIQKDDALVPSDLMELSITHDNGLRGQPAIGTLGYIGIGAGRSNTTGNVQVYLDSVSAAAFYNAGVQNNAFKLSFKLSDNAGNTQVWTLYRIKLNSLSDSAEAIDQDVMIDSGFQAVLDSSGVAGVTIQVDRFDA